MILKLPPRLISGRVVHVEAVNCVSVRLDLDFSISVVRRVVLEGIEVKNIQPKHRRNANHCLIVLLGGKDVIVHTDQTEYDGGAIIGRIYLNEKIYGTPVGMATPHGLEQTMLEVSTFYQSLEKVDYNVDSVKSVLNGNGVHRA